MSPRLSRQARLLQVLTILGMALLLLMPALIWAEPGIGRPAAGWRGALEGLAWPDRLAGWALGLPPFLAAAIGLGQLHGFCRSLARREVFSAAAARALGRFGWCLIAAAIALPCSRLAVIWHVSPPGTSAGGMLALLGALPVLALLMGIIMGLVFVIFAAILDEATRLAEENAGFV